MKIKGIRKQGNAKNSPNKSYGQIYMPLRKMRNPYAKSKKDGIHNVTVKLENIGAAYYSEKVLIVKASKTVQKLISRKVIGPESLVDVHFERLKLRHTLGIKQTVCEVWPPYRVNVKNGIVVKIEKMKKI